jgi:copper homeostasis protein
MNRRLAVEIAVQDLEGVRIALGEGADRVELCSALGVGGLTPSPGMIERAAEIARDAGSVEFVNVLVRPRAGGFSYTRDELDVVTHDIRHLRELGADGLVIGVLDDDGRVDFRTIRDLVVAAGPLAVTFHRAIDAAADPVADVAELAAVGVRRVLSSGRAERSADGTGILASMVSAGGGRIQIMAGGGVGVSDIPTLAATGVDAVHLSGRRVVSGSPSGPGGGESSYDATDRAIVRSAVEAARALAD